MNRRTISYLLRLAFHERRRQQVETTVDDVRLLDAMNLPSHKQGSSA